jgi:hypothetical protein
MVHEDLRDVQPEAAFQSYTVLESSAVVGEEFSLALIIAALAGEKIRFLVLDHGKCQ